MKIIIRIINYVESIDVLVDGIKLEIEELSFFSSAKFQSEVGLGIHEIVVIKNSEIMKNNWKFTALKDWMSCMLGVPDWTLTEKKIDERICSMFFKVKVEQDININLKLMKDGFELEELSDEILDIVKQTGTSEIAQKRVKSVYMIPPMILAIVIEFCILTVGILLVTSGQYMRAVAVFVLAVFWGWLVYNMLFKR